MATPSDDPKNDSWSNFVRCGRSRKPKAFPGGSRPGVLLAGRGTCKVSSLGALSRLQKILSLNKEVTPVTVTAQESRYRRR